jgi:hypothetical protein
MKFRKIFSETPQPISTKLCWNDPWMVPFRYCVHHFRPPTKMAATVELNLTSHRVLCYLSLAVAAILVGGLKCWTRFWKGTIQGSFQQSLVEIGSVVSEKIFLNFISPKPLEQLQPNFGGMVLGWPPSKRCVRWSRLPTKMSAKLKIEKRGDEI